MEAVAAVRVEGSSGGRSWGSAAASGRGLAAAPGRPRARGPEQPGRKGLTSPTSAAAMSELSDEASEPELLNRSLSMWHGLGAQVSREELAVPLDLHTAASVGQYEVVKECVQR